MIHPRLSLSVVATAVTALLAGTAIYVAYVSQQDPAALQQADDASWGPVESVEFTIDLSTLEGLEEYVECNSPNPIQLVTIDSKNGIACESRYGPIEIYSLRDPQEAQDVETYASGGSRQAVIVGDRFGVVVSTTRQADELRQNILALNG